MMQKIIKHSNKIIYALTSLIIFELGFVFSLFINWSAVEANFKNLNFKKGSLPKAFIVQSGSMEPSIKTGSLVFTIPQKNYRVGEVVTFQHSPTGKNLITHRIVGVSGEGEYTTKGDANEESDTQTISAGQIVGRTFFPIPYLGYLANFAKNPKGFILLVIVPATIVIYEELKNLKKELGRFLSKIALRFRRKKREVGSGVAGYDYIFPSPLSKSKNVPFFAVAVPVFGAFLILVAATASYFSDHEKSSSNILGAAENFASPTATESVSPTPTAIQKPVINEFLPDSSSEFVEFYNPQDNADYLKTYYLDDDDAFGNGTGQGSSMILLTALNTDNVHYPFINISSFLNNEGDKVVLFDESGNIVDQYTYPPPDPLNEITIGRIPDASGSFVNLSTNSKGAANTP